jgi:hypothetical protein
MTDPTCPKCNLKKDDPVRCSGCGIRYGEYETQKHQKLGEVYRLLSENKFADARRITEKLPLEFPDNRGDFLLLLSNINRDISIIEKCELAQQSCDNGDYARASFLLRNIKAFDKKLDEKVISLRRKIERFSQSSVHFSEAVDAMNKGNYGRAKTLFEKIEDTRYLEEVSGFLQKIDEIRDEMLGEVVGSIRRNQLNGAGKNLDSLLAAFPGMESETEAYAALVSHQVKMKNMIRDAAVNALYAGRYIESKVLCLFLGMQYPDAREEVRPLIREIGDKAIISFAEMDEYGVVDMATLGLKSDDDGLKGLTASTGENGKAMESGSISETVSNGTPGISVNEAVEKSREAVHDTVRKPVDFGGVVVADFIF